MRLPKIKSVTTKSILIVVLCFVVFISAAIPVVRDIMFNSLRPFLIDHINMKMGNSAALMSNFLYYSNTHTRYRALNKEFQAQVDAYAHDEMDEAQFREEIYELIEPFESEVVASANKSHSFTSYSAFFLESKGLVCNDEIKPIAQKLLSSNWFQKYKSNYTSGRLYSPVFKGDDGKEYFAYIFTNYKQVQNNQESEFFYSFVITDFSYVKTICGDSLNLKVEDYYFCGPGSDYLYKNKSDSSLDLNWVREHVMVVRQHYVVTFEEDTDVYFSVLVSSEDEDIWLVMHAAEEDFHKLYGDNAGPILGLFVAMLIVFVLVILFILRHIFKRLTKLSKKMAVVQNGVYNVKLEDKSMDEIGQLTASFNKMTDKINDNVKRLIEKEERERLLQYNLMVSAIDPHFVYNTLNTSTRLAELGRTQDVVEVNDALINCLKDNLKMKSLQAYDTVENEKTMLKQYIKIQNYLCDNKIVMKFDAEPKELALKIPKFMLQPIIENAIIHGILLNVDENGNPIDGEISVTVKSDDKSINITVCDNGIGMSEEAIERYFKKDESEILNDESYFEHIGVLNIRTRLSYLFHNNYTLDVSSRTGVGTMIAITIPLTI